MSQGDILPFRVSAFVAPGSGTRHLLEHRGTRRPTLAASLYEVHLSLKSDSPNTRSAALRTLAYLYAWGGETGHDVERTLLTGDGFSIAEVRAFAAWLRKRWSDRSGAVPPEKRRTHNAIVDECRRASVWFVEQFALSHLPKAYRSISLQQLIATEKSAWKEARHKVVAEDIAGNLADDEIQAIENFLRPANQTKKVKEDKAVRDYLIWRMAIEFGMRRSEILAMRTIDCPSLHSPYFKIVRIEERGPDYVDPRAPRAPRPKTLSHDVGIVMRNTQFPKLVNEYITAHRYAAIKRLGRRVRQWLLPHNFLLVSESGKPLSQEYMGALAAQIRAATGTDFHWHLARHAFFNRAYAAVVEIKDPEERQIRLGDLIQWGGWADPSSLDIYVRAARRIRAQSALMFWQTGGNTWTALD